MKYLAITLFFLSIVSCTVTVPFGFQTKLKIDKVEVKYAEFEKEPSFLSKAAPYGVAAAGGYAAYQANIINIDKQGDNKWNRPVNALGGAVIGWGLTYWINKIIENKQQDIPVGRNQDLIDKWIYTSGNENYKFLKHDYEPSSFTMIHREAYQNYIFNLEDDINDYLMAFGYNNPYFSDAFNRSIDKFDHRFQLYLYQKHEKNISSSFIDPIAEKIYQKAKPFDELAKVMIEIPHKKQAYKEVLFKSIKTLSHLETALSIFPEDRPGIFREGLEIMESTEELAKIFRIFPEYKEVLMDTLINNINSFEDFKEMWKYFPEYKSKSYPFAFELANTIEEYRILSITVPANYYECRDEALKLVVTLKDCIEFAKAFPNDKVNVEQKAFNLAKSIEEYSLVYNHFDGYKDESAQEAFNLCSSIDDYAKFKELFPNYESDAIREAKKLVNSIYTLKSYLSSFERKRLSEIDDLELLSKVHYFGYNEQMEISNLLKVSNHILKYGINKFCFYIPSGYQGVLTLRDQNPGIWGIDYSAYNNSISGRYEKKMYIHTKGSYDNFLDDFGHEIVLLNSKTGEFKVDLNLTRTNRNTTVTFHLVDANSNTYLNSNYNFVDLSNLIFNKGSEFFGAPDLVDLFNSKGSSNIYWKDKFLRHAYDYNYLTYDVKVFYQNVLHHFK